MGASRRFGTLLPAAYTGYVWPYVTPEHLREIAALIAWSDERARFYELRERIRRARTVRQVKRTWEAWVMATTFEVGPDNVAREVSDRPAQDGGQSYEFWTGFRWGLAITLAVGLAESVRRLGTGASKAPRRRRR